MSIWAVLAVVVGVLGLVALGVWGLPWLASKRQGYPHEAELEAAVLPVLYHAICAAYKVSERAVDELGARMAGADKGAIARGLYEVLPDEVKRMVPQQAWAPLVEGAFEQFLAFYGEAALHLDDEFAEWAEAWAPESWAMDDEEPEG